MNKKFFPRAILALIVLAAASLLMIDIVGQSSPLPGVQIGEARGYTPTSSGREAPTGQKEYYSSHYGFSLLYPAEYLVHEYTEQGGAMTVTFEYDDGKAASGFQIFVAPFAGEQITDERFRQDVPSGVREGLRDITVDGATGASFYSEDAMLGATAEVWFIGNGYLYEISTLRELAPWLSDILATWKFM